LSTRSNTALKKGFWRQEIGKLDGIRPKKKDISMFAFTALGPQCTETAEIVAFQAFSAA
jgi:hypothetical protein